MGEVLGTLTAVLGFMNNPPCWQIPMFHVVVYDNAGNEMALMFRGINGTPEFVQTLRGDLSAYRREDEAGRTVEGN